MSDSKAMDGEYTPSQVLDGLVSFHAQEAWKSVYNTVGNREDSLLIGESLYVDERQVDHVGIKIPNINQLVEKLVNYNNPNWGTFKKVLGSEVVLPNVDSNRQVDGHVFVVYTNRHNINFLVVLSYMLSVTNLGINTLAVNLHNVPTPVHEVYKDPELLYKYRVHIYPYNSHL